MSVRCELPAREDYPDLIEAPEEYGHWRTDSGWCSGTGPHGYCAEANGVRRVFEWAHPKREVVVEEGPGYVVTAVLE